MVPSLKKILSRVGNYALDTVYYGVIAATIGISATTANYYHQRAQHQPSKQELRIEQEHQIEILGEPTSGELFQLNQILEEKEIQGPLSVEYVSDKLLERHALDLVMDIFSEGYYSSHLKHISLISREKRTLVHELAHYQSYFLGEDFFQAWLKIVPESSIDLAYDNRLLSRLSHVIGKLGVQFRNPTDEQMYQGGFIRRYGWTNYDEDIATITEAIDTLPLSETHQKMGNNSTFITKANLLEKKGIANLGKRLDYEDLVTRLESELRDEADGFYYPIASKPGLMLERIQQLNQRIDGFIAMYPKSEEADRLRGFKGYIADSRDFIARWEVVQDHNHQDKTALVEKEVLESTTPEQKINYECSDFADPLHGILRQGYF